MRVEEVVSTPSRRLRCCGRRTRWRPTRGWDGIPLLHATVEAVEAQQLTWVALACLGIAGGLGEEHEIFDLTWDGWEIGNPVGTGMDRQGRTASITLFNPIQFGGIQPTYRHGYVRHGDGTTRVYEFPLVANQLTGPYEYVRTYASNIVRTDCLSEEDVATHRSVSDLADACDSLDRALAELVYAPYALPAVYADCQGPSTWPGAILLCTDDTRFEAIEWSSYTAAGAEGVGTILDKVGSARVRLTLDDPVMYGGERLFRSVVYSVDGEEGGYLAAFLPLRAGRDPDKAFEVIRGTASLSCASGFDLAVVHRRCGLDAARADALFSLNHSG